MAMTKSVNPIIASTVVRMAARSRTGCRSGAWCLATLGTFRVCGQAEECVDGVECRADAAAQVGRVRVFHPGPQHFHEPADEKPGDRLRGQAGDRGDHWHALRRGLRSEE